MHKNIGFSTAAITLLKTFNVLTPAVYPFTLPESIVGNVD